MNNIISIKEEKGAAGLEFTIVFPLLLMVTFGIIEFGALMFDKAILTNAAREGARAGIIYNYQGPGNPTCGDLGTIQTNVQTVVNQYLGNFLINFNPNEVENIDVSVGQVNAEYTLTVRVNYRFHFIFIDSIINLLFNGALDPDESGILLDAVAEMRGEDQSLLFDLQGC